MRQVRRDTIIIAIAVLLFGSVFVYGQRYRFGYGFRVQNNEPPPTELVVARWQYTAYGKFGGTGWSHNWPTSDYHIAQVISEATNVNATGMSYRIVQLGSPEGFDYPFAVVSEPGEMALTDHEVDNLREYIDRGGFVILDDFDGAHDLKTLERDFHKAFPDRDFERLTIENPLFNNFFHIDALNITSPYLVDGARV